MKRRIHLKAPAVHLKKLVNLMGLEKAAKEIGVTTWAIRRYLNNEETSPSIEIAAQHVWEKMTAVSDSEQIAIIKTNQITMQFIQQIVKTTDGNYTLIK